MFYSLTGTVVFKDISSVAVDCNGVAFLMSVTQTTLSKLPREGEAATLFTHLNVREDAMDLYGFADKWELDCFRLLTTVSGVGPKAALSILSALTPDRLAVAIASGDVKAITSAQGVGAKIAQRVVLELKGKLGDIAADSAAMGDAAAAGKAAVGYAGEEAVEALVQFGYSRSEASVAVGRLDPSLSTQELIKQALSRLAKQL